MEEVFTVDLSIDWKTGMKYLIAVIESHAKKSYFETADDEATNALVKEQLMHCAEVADYAVELQKKDPSQPDTIEINRS
jgi:hypothetical protein